MRYFDSHAHYNDERFTTEYEGGALRLLDELFSGTVSGIVNVGTSPDTCREVIALAKQFKNMYTALGLHPSDARFITDIDGALGEIGELILDPENKCVCLGEIGLDYHYPDTNVEMQKTVFRRQMEMARRLSLPVSIHDREAHGDVMEILREYPKVKGILHSFSGSAEMAKELCAMGYMISFSGTVTFTNARRVWEAATSVPMEHILIETDCPYLAPHPLRGSLNHSGNLAFTNRKIAELHGISEALSAEITEANAKRIFSLS